MTTEQGFRLITRGISIFCILSALIALSFLPPDALAVGHYWGQMHGGLESAQALTTESYLFREYLLRCADLVLQIVVLLWIAGWLYRSGPALQRFFLDSQKSEEGHPLP
jgi:hypothetical protein